MKCIICNSESHFYFSKKYTEPPFNDFMREIGEVNYFKCSNCGFVISETHSKLDDTKWQNLNYLFHHYLENSGFDKKINQPPYPEQAMMISFLGKNKIIETEDMIDFAGGYGTLSNILDKYHDIKLPIFDPYVQSGKLERYIARTELRTYKTVINSAMFEHVLSRKDLEQVNDMVDPEGCLIIHTVVCENVPKDPNWFYLAPPVHTAFHTNRSMEILMNQWNYSSSIYSPKGKCWVLLRGDIDSLEWKIKNINEELQTNWFFCKRGFVDYWKGF